MKLNSYLLSSIFCLLALCATSAAPTQAVTKNSADNTITGDLVFPSGKTLTIAAGATLDATGATIIGVGGTPSWFDATGTGYNVTAAFSLSTSDFVDGGSVQIGVGANGSNSGAAMGYGANGSISGAAMGYGANGSSFGSASGCGSDGSNSGAAIGFYSNGSSYGAASGAYSDGHGLGNIALGGNDGMGANSIVPDGWTDTAEIGRGTATLQGGLNFRGIGIVDYNAGAPKLVIASAGTITDNNAAAGDVGEYVPASVVKASATSLVTSTPKTVTSITLTAGDWDITAIGAITGASTGTAFDVAVGTTTNSFTDTVLGDTRAQTPTVSLTGADATLMIPAVRVSISATTTYFLIVQETFTLGSPAAYGRLSARRIR